MLFSHPQTYNLCLETGTPFSFRPSGKPAPVQRGKSVLAGWAVSPLEHLLGCAAPAHHMGAETCCSGRQKSIWTCAQGGVLLN